MKYLRWLLFPLSLLYGLVVIIRNYFYDAGILKSRRFNMPVISVGNLEVGGAGKSPITEYLIRLLKDHYKLATLSRGYGGNTKGFIELDADTKVDAKIAGNTALAAQIGDEPAQFRHKFQDITVAVCENRVEGIKKLLPAHNLIILDDAYQHRAVEPGLSILLFDYHRLSQPLLLLPAGNLREPFSGRWRAQVIIITKCPAEIGLKEQQAAAEKIESLPYQKLFFTTIAYQPLQYLDGRQAQVTIDSETAIFLLTGVANPKPLLRYLNGFTRDIIHHNYPDHHTFTLKNITKLAAGFSACEKQNKIIITTEKDAQRLEESWFSSSLPGEGRPPVFVIPIKFEFLNDSGRHFEQLITEYVREYKANDSIH